jgi:hypothetical protein
MVLYYVAPVSRVLRAAQQARLRSTLGRAAMEKGWHRPDGKGMSAAAQNRGFDGEETR